MADGSCKLSEEIVAGDELLTIDADGKTSAEKVIRTLGDVQALIRIAHERGEFVCSESHRLLLTGREETRASSLVPGDYLLTPQGESRIEGVYAAGKGQVYGWTCEPSHTFVAEGVLHHNKIAAASIINM